MRGRHESDTDVWSVVPAESPRRGPETTIDGWDSTDAGQHGPAWDDREAPDGRTVDPGAPRVGASGWVEAGVPLGSVRIRNGAWAPRRDARAARGRPRPGGQAAATPGSGEASGRNPGGDPGFPDDIGQLERQRRGGMGIPRIGKVALLLACAALVVVVGAAIIGPVVTRAIVDLAASNPSAMRFGPVAAVVKSDLGSKLGEPASTNGTLVHFVVRDGATAALVAHDLQAQGLVRDSMAVTYLIVTRDLSDQIAAGTYELAATMTPEQIVERLQLAPEIVVAVDLRTGLRIEQIAAYLQTLDLHLDVQEFVQLATSPSDSLRADYPFLSTLPDGRSLEGYLAAGTYQVYRNVTAEQLVRMLLDGWGATVGEAPIRAAESSGRDFYAVLALASIVEHEAAVEAEGSLIAGVYVSRLRTKMLLNADPTVIYAWDTVKLRALAFSQWRDYSFWNPVGKALASVKLPADLAGYQTYTRRGMIPGPICTPSLASILAALNPDTEAGYLYFVAKGDGSHTHAFAKTLQEHEANLARYGYK
jgi:UPF0755 protein